MKQDYETSEGVVTAPWSGEGNKGTRRNNACQLSLLVQGRMYVLVIGFK